MTRDEILSTYEELEKFDVWSAFQRTAKRLPEKVVVVDGDRRVTFRELSERIERLAAGLRKLGLAKGDMAGIYLKNSLELIEVFYALQKIGAVIAWLNPNYRETESGFILENSGAKAVFLFDSWGGYDYLAAMEAMKKSLPELKHVVYAKGGDGSAVEPQEFAVDLASLYLDAPDTSASSAFPDDLSMLIYTSGTTGKPKGAMIRHSQVVRAGWGYSMGVEAGEEDVFIAFLPMTHSYGCGALLVQPFILGARVVLLDRFTTADAFRLMEAEKVTIQLGSPAHYLMELRDATRANYDFSTLRAGLIAGQIAPEGLIATVEKEFGIYISSFLGSSEVGPGLSIILPYKSPLEVRETSIGYPIPGTQARIADPVTGEEKPDGEHGELLLTGWHLMSGYWKNPAETQNQLKNGWLHTGDLAVRDEHGRMRILGRIKEWINRGGLKIVPSELEGYLQKHPAIIEVFVVGTNNPILGESICVCARVSEALTLKELRTFLSGKVAPFKLPDELLIVEDFPRLSGGIKVNKFGAGGLVEIAVKATDKQTLAR